LEREGRKEKWVFQEKKQKSAKSKLRGFEGNE